MSPGIPAIRPPLPAPRFPTPFVRMGKIIHQPFGDDPLMTPVRLPAGVNPDPYSTVPVAFEPGATLNVLQ